jgi:hypothetical protein
MRNLIPVSTQLGSHILCTHDFYTTSQAHAAAERGVAAASRTAGRAADNKPHSFKFEQINSTPHLSLRQ